MFDYVLNKWASPNVIMQLTKLTNPSLIALASCDYISNVSLIQQLNLLLQRRWPIYDCIFRQPLQF